MQQPRYMKWYSRRAAYMAERKCYMCHATTNLELDHRDPSQKIAHNVWAWAQDRRDQELAKCDPLCRDCHRLKTLLLDRPLAPHGTLSGYMHSRCRCDACREAWNGYMRERRAKEKVKSESFTPTTIQERV